MIIVSKFKDYYDGGAVYGIDTQRRYIRETEEVKIDQKYNFEIIGFCGKLYPLDNVMNIMDFDPKKYVNYNPALEFEFSEGRNLQKKAKLVPAKKFSYTYAWWNSRMNKAGYWDTAKKDKKYLKLFLKYKVPIFYIRQTTLILNPCLKNLGFYKVMDTTQAFQEIEMYLSNVLVSDTQHIIVPVGNDNVIRDSKGFDKWTFRKEKEK